MEAGISLIVNLQGWILVCCSNNKAGKIIGIIILTLSTIRVLMPYTL